MADPVVTLLVIRLCFKFLGWFNKECEKNKSARDPDGGWTTLKNSLYVGKEIVKQGVIQPFSEGWREAKRRQRLELCGECGADTHTTKQHHEDVRVGFLMMILAIVSVLFFLGALAYHFRW